MMRAVAVAVASSSPTPRGSRPVVRLALALAMAMAMASPESRSSRNFLAMIPRASSQETGSNAEPATWRLSRQ